MTVDARGIKGQNMDMYCAGDRQYDWFWYFSTTIFFGSLRRC